jgi:phenylacetate-coenzyme A ligase PaaK-like adenylate-forming protein
MKNEIFRICNDEQFQECCLKIFHFQYSYNPVYRQYVNLLEIDRNSVNTIKNIPFLPIRFFKSHTIISSADAAVEAQKVFTSSSTTGMTPSKHYVVDLRLYEESFLSAFRMFYGDPSEYVILALLPSYLERDGSSLVYMAEHLIKLSNRPESGFYLYNHEELFSTLLALRAMKKKTLLLGVTFALLDFASKYSLEQSDARGQSPSDWSLTVMETGGMKGRGEELPREEVHRRLKMALGVNAIHSEYGMCELLSQAYSRGKELFQSPPWMKIVLRDFSNPFKITASDEIAAGEKARGPINIIDLANVNSCSFIETEDVGSLYPDGQFTIESRISHSERRGCNMLIE